MRDRAGVRTGPCLRPKLTSLLSCTSSSDGSECLTLYWNITTGHKLKKYQLSLELASILKATGSMWCGINFSSLTYMFGSVGKLSTSKKNRLSQNSKALYVNIKDSGQRRK